MSTGGQRDRAEAVFGHLQHAAREMIAAARDGLDMVDDAVAGADLAEVFDTVNHLSRAILKSRPPPKSGARPAPESSEPPAQEAREAQDTREARTDSPVQRISVR
jgi:hypothetical protein